MLIVTAIIGHLSLHSGFAWLIGELRGFMKLNLEFFVMCGHNFKASEKLSPFDFVGYYFLFLYKHNFWL